MQGLAITTEQIIEILSLYSTAERTVAAVVADPGWTVCGAFPMPQTATIRLDLLGSVSHASLTMRVRLYCTTAGFVGAVSGSDVLLSSVIDARVFSAAFDLAGGREYQVQAEVTGNAGSDYFGIVHRVAPTGT